MKRSRSDVPTGASLFRELKLKRQRLSMLLNRDINDVLSSTSSSDTGDHGSDGDAGPPLMLREDSACFESRRHDAVDSGASSDGDWSFCGYTNRHPPMLIPIIDQTQLLPSRAAQPSALFSGHLLSNDQQMFTSGKPGLEAESDSNITSASAQGIDFCHTNVTAASSTVTSSCIIANVSQSSMASDTSSHAEMERNSGTKSKLSSGIWQLRNTFRKGHSCNAEKYNHQPNGITSGLAFPQHLVKDGTEMGSFPSADNNSVVPVSLMPPATDSDPVSDPSTKDCYNATVGQMDVNASMTMSSQSCPSSGDDQSCRQTTVSFTTDHVHCERTCLEERSVIRCGSDLVIGIKLEDTLRANPVPAAVALANGDKPVLDWRRLEKLKQTQETCYSPLKQDKAEPSKEQLVCEICTDRASGLHYGIISCEGCKGFFKRTVQNKRVYSCIAEGDCQVTKLRRNRCQYCRFKKCLLKGMVLAAVRDDRMPGGRNSGAVYSLYKVKYRKPGRTADNGVRRAIVPRWLRSVHGVTSKPAQSRAGTSSHCDATARPLWQISHSIQDVDTASHCDTSLWALPQCAALCSQVIDGGIHNRNVSAESLSVSEDTNMSTGNHSASHNRQINADSATVSHYPNADSPTVSRYLKADSPTVSRYLSAESPTVSRYLSADSPTVSRHLSADSPTVSRHLSADSPTVSHVRYSDNVDMNHTRRTVIADSRKMTEDRSQTSYDRVNMNALYGNINYNNENMDSHHMNQSIHKMSFSVDSETKSSDIVDHLVHVDELLQCEHAHDLAAATQPYSGASLTTLLQHLSDNVVRELVKWMKTLPFYNQLPISVHRHCLAEKWYDLLLLTMLAHQACTGHAQDSTTDDVNSHVARNVRRLQRGLRHVLEHELPIDELYREVGDIVQKLTDIVLNFRKLGLTREEYVCLKVILLLNRECMADANQTAEHIQDVYRSVLQQLVTDTFPHQPTRLSELLLQLPHIQTASALLMKTNTIYIPSMLNAPLHQQ